MPLIIIIGLVIAALWWVKGQQTTSSNERLYLRRRGYATEQGPRPAEPVAKDSRLLGLIESLEDLSPYARKRAAEELVKLRKGGERDQRIYTALIFALDDSDPTVRAAVATALASLGEARAVEPMTNRLEVEESLLVRSSLKRAIEKLSAQG